MDTFENVIGTPIGQEGENDFTGGLFTLDGAFLTQSEHKRSLTGHVHRVNNIDAAHLKPDSVLEEGIYGGFAFNHFGHFLVESLGRLWPANHPEFCELPIYFHPVWGRINTDDEGAFAHQILKLLGIDPRRIQFINEVSLVKKVHIPEQLYGFHLLEHVDERMLKFLSAAQRRIENRLSSEAASAENLYVSRSKWLPEKGLIAGEREFEQFLAQNGWTVFYPEDHSFSAQLKRYCSARRIIFSEGSAYHSLILLPKIAANIAILFRRIPGWNQQRIEAQFRGFDKSLLSIQRVERQVCAGMPKWSGVSLVDLTMASEDLMEHGFVSRKFGEWRNISTSVCDESLARFVGAVATDKRFQTFLYKYGDDCLDG
jgi:capsular polysaccharide biosynthesis protein